MLTKEEFILLRDFIYDKTGIYFAENKTYLLESRLTNRLSELGFSTFQDYYYHLKYGGDKVKAELISLFEVVTTNETFFFRNPPQLDAFKVILKKTYLNGAAPTQPIRIWSAGCSTGEEPYTLAIIMEEEMAAAGKTVPYVIYGTDISTKVLESAKLGLFNNYSVRTIEEGSRKKYFTETGGFYKLKDNLKKNVKLDFLNLQDADAYRKYRQMDMIFCRNVLIYFDEKMKKKVVDLFYECLKPQGFLTIGHAESLHNISRVFKPLVFPGTITYQKG
ncbi:MAG TPA: protein-glutamate O-methyltransferase CheR [Syntrophorhabdaceae bacterium]|jgi:chemotaxis protein methyltransferase CheR